MNNPTFYFCFKNSKILVMENSKKNIHRFPGHMKKASNQIVEKLKLVDFVICLLDARAPESTFNKYLLNLVKDKKKLYILNKSDLSDAKITAKWVEKLNNEGNIAISVSLQNKGSKDIIFKAINTFIKEKEEKMLKKGIKKTTSRAMVIGIPNVGKSTFINFLLEKNRMKAANTPGFTKSISWAKVNDRFEIMDTPGILEPKFENKTQAINLALIGAIKDNILPSEELSFYCLDFLKNNYKKEVENKYVFDFNEMKNEHDFFINLAVKRGYLKHGNEPDIDKAEFIFLNEFKNGGICKFSLEII